MSSSPGALSRSTDPLFQLDLISHGRSGPGGSLRFSPAEVQQIARTVRRVPEVIVKVSGGGRDVGGVQAHLKYIDRHGKLALETDDGRSLQGKNAAAQLVDDWNLDLSTGQHRTDGAGKAIGPKLVHNIVLSMPRKTPADAMLAAAQRFAREEFALQHRYAMVLHTDQDHPHVHLVVKAEHEYEPGQRLNIRKATLRRWREAFAAALREQGVAANASSLAARGRTRTGKKDPIYRRMKAQAPNASEGRQARLGGKSPVGSSFMRQKVEAIAAELRQGRLTPESGQQRLRATREEVTRRWQAAIQVLRDQGEAQLASEVEQFVKSLPAVRTEKELIAAGLLAELATVRRESDVPRDPNPHARDR